MRSSSGWAGWGVPRPVISPAAARAFSVLIPSRAAMPTARRTADRVPSARPMRSRRSTCRYDPHAGCLLPEPCVAAHLDLAARHGADLHHGEPARSWSPDGAGVRVETDRASYTASALVITAGPWAGEVLGDLHLPLQPWRMYNVYFAPTRPELFGPD